MPDQPRLQGFPPMTDGRSRILILGSFPGVQSLDSQRYYGNPFNHFWALVGVARDSIAPPFDQFLARCEWLLDLGIAIWDVIGECSRPGSLDQAIRNPYFNDIAGLLALWPGIGRIILNGGVAARLYERHIIKTLAEPKPLHIRVPSSSPIPSRDFRRIADKQPAWTSALDLETLP